MVLWDGLAEVAALVIDVAGAPHVVREGGRPLGAADGLAPPGPPPRRVAGRPRPDVDVVGGERAALRAVAGVDVSRRVTAVEVAAARPGEVTPHGAGGLAVRLAVLPLLGLVGADAEVETAASTCLIDGAAIPR